MADEILEKLKVMRAGVNRKERQLTAVVGTFAKDEQETTEYKDAVVDLMDVVHRREEYDSAIEMQDTETAFNKIMGK